MSFIFQSKWIYMNYNRWKLWDFIRFYDMSILGMSDSPQVFSSSPSSQSQILSQTQLLIMHSPDEHLNSLSMHPGVSVCSVVGAVVTVAIAKEEQGLLSVAMICCNFSLTLQIYWTDAEAYHLPCVFLQIQMRLPLHSGDEFSWWLNQSDWSLSSQQNGG